MILRRVREGVTDRILFIAHVRNIFLPLKENYVMRDIVSPLDPLFGSYHYRIYHYKYCTADQEQAHQLGIAYLLRH